MNHKEFTKINELIRLKYDIEYDLQDYKFNDYNIPYTDPQSMYDHPKNTTDAKLIECYKEMKSEMTIKFIKILQDALDEVVVDLKKLGYEDE